MIYLRYDTESQEIVLGPFVDSTDGNTEETGLTIANTDIKLWKAGATTLANKNSGGATHISNGMYYAVLDATDTNTLGSMRVYVHVSGALAVIVDAIVLPQKVYDSLISGSDNLEIDLIQIAGSAVSTTSAQLGVNVVQVSGDSTAADNLEAACDGTGYNVGNGAVVAASVTGNVGGNISGTVPNSAGVTTLLGLVTEARMGALTDWINGGRLDLILDAIAGDVVNLDGAAMRGTDNAALASAWTATRAGYVDLLNTYLDAAISSRLSSSGYTAPDNASITSILEDTGTTIPAQISGLNNLSSAQAQTAAAAALTAYDPPTKAELDSAVSPLATSVALATVDGNVDSILTDTGTTIPAQINGLNNLSSAQAQSAAAAALTAYDPPTKAEMDAGHALLATAASIAALNNISTAQVLAQATAALEATITEPTDLTDLSAKGILYHLFSRFFHRNTQTATAQVTYKANGTTALATRTASDDGTTQELGKAI